MAYSEYYAPVALAGAVAGIGARWGKKWFDRMVAKTLAVRSAEVLVEHDQDCDEVDVVIDSTEEVQNIIKKRKHRGLFRNYLKVQGKAKFGCPSDTPANRMVVRKYLVDLCVDKGLLARHIVDNVDFAVSMVFVPSHQEVMAAAVSHTQKAKDRGWLLKKLGGQRPQVA